MGIAIESIADLVAASLRDLGRGKWTDLTTDYQEFYILPKILEKEKVKFDGGRGPQWNVLTGTAGTAKWVNLYQEDTPAAVDNMQQASAPWAHSTTNYSFDRREPEIASGKMYQIYDIVKSRRAQAFMDLAILCEAAGWGMPATTNNQQPYGLKYYITYNATTGFNGGNPTGFSNCAGIDASAFPRWRNYTAQYANITKDDLVIKARDAIRLTVFKSPLNPMPPDYRRSGERRCIYAGNTVVRGLETLAEFQNDNLGHDLLSQFGEVMLHRIPVEYVPFFDWDTGCAAAAPMVGIDWGTFYPHFLEGEYLNEGKPMPAPFQHTAVTVHTDLTLQFACKNRRNNWFIGTQSW